MSDRLWSAVPCALALFNLFARGIIGHCLDRCSQGETSSDFELKKAPEHESPMRESVADIPVSQRGSPLVVDE